MAEDDILYGKVSDENGEDYLCPLNQAATETAAVDDIPDDCVEASVVGRYAGNIQLADTTQDRP